MGRAFGAVVALGLLCLFASTAFAATTTVAAATTTTSIAPSSTTAVPTTAAPTPPPVLDSDVSYIDLIFSYFAQDSTAVSQYASIIAGTVNVTTRRIAFEKSGGRIGYLFGSNVRVRITVQSPIITETETRPAMYIRQALLDLATNGPDSRLSNIGVLSGEAVDTLVAYEYSVFTAWDLLWTLLIVAGCMLFLSFVLYVVYRFYSDQKMTKLEATMAAKRAEAEKAPAAESAGRSMGIIHISGGKIVFPNPEEKMGWCEFDSDHDDGEIDPSSMGALVESIAYAATKSQQGSPFLQQQDSAQRLSSNGSDNFVAPATTERNGVAPVAVLSKALEQNRNVTTFLPPAESRSALAMYLDTVSLPPASGSARSPTAAMRTRANSTLQSGGYLPSALKSPDARPQQSPSGVVRRVRLDDTEL